MRKQFHLGQAHIDLTRNQITLAGQMQTMQPKAIAVLAALIDAQGEVVSVESLLQRVWPDTVVTPNTLQRCIAQLRKALADDSREQRIIKTHAKQGYSLEVSATPVGIAACSDLPINNRRARSVWYLTLAALVLLSLLMTFFYLNPDKAQPYNKLHYLTSTSGKDSFASYSPDGRYMVFHRFVGQCDNHLWIKDLQSQLETRLTSEAGFFQQHSFAPGADRLAFVGKSICAKPDIPECWELKTLDITAALAGSQPAQTRISCDDGKLYGAQWMNNGEIALLKKPHQGQWQLISYHVRDNVVRPLYTPTDQRLYNLAYSAGSDTLALLGKSIDGKDKLTLLNSQGEVLSSLTLHFPVALSQFALFELSFHPQQPKLLVYTTHHQFEVNLNGHITTISPLVAKAIYSLVYAPHQHKLLAAYGMQDWGFYLQQLPAEVAEKRQLAEKWDSTFADTDARFQPQGNLIAFVSNRSGQEQVWLMDEQRVWQLSQFTQGSIAGLHWSASGQKLLVNHNDQLLLLDLNGATEALPAPFAAMQLYQWSAQDEILFSTQVAWQQRIIAWTPQNNQWHEWQVPASSWAQLDDNGNLLSLYNNGELWLHKPDNAAPPQLLLSGIQKRFAWQDGNILAVNKSNQLVRFNIATLQELSRIPLSTTSMYVDDSQNNQLLIAEINDVQQDIVELRP